MSRTARSLQPSPPHPKPQVPGTTTTVRVDNPHVPGQQKHAHVKPKGKPEVVINKDGTGSHNSDPKNLTKNKKVREFLKKKGFRILYNPYFLMPDPDALEQEYCRQNPHGIGCIPVQDCGWM
ncbi:hypothetical protein [Zooshikella ganghwensis]|uniref:Uncharacterized protein n=1 Tax=Zooshikella ganghwensis TaxID=202772 RepID=A0A4P9VMR7_9GAMM|nr:hypothetical protein [Zooshikella ganghwensis]RDH43684.1 hypothetical protein B9G39_09665 [Zooshikella ganghwensis]